MFELAGLIIERASGKRWDEFLTDRLWHPIGMNETFSARGQITSDKSHALPYHFVDGQLSLAEWDLDENHADAAGSVWSLEWSLSRSTRCYVTSAGIETMSAGVGCQRNSWLLGFAADRDLGR